jgi:hypothetical protein
MLALIDDNVASMLIIELSGTAVESKFSESKLFLSLVVNQPRLLLVLLDPC